MRTSPRLLLAAASTALLGGCSKAYDIKKLRTPADVPDVATFCPQAQDLVVKRFSACGAATPELVRSQLYLPCEDQWQWAIGKGHAGYDPYAASDCLAAVEAKPCALLLPPNGEIPDVCLQIVSGGLADGQACDVDAECGSGLCLATATCPGICAPFSGEAGSCSGRRNVGPQCDRGKVCNGGTCERFRYQGESCVGHEQGCEPGTFCDGSTCTAQMGTGAPCSGPDVECQPGLVCAVVALSPLSRECRSPRLAGDSCVVGAGECLRGTYCQSATQVLGTPGSCTSWPTGGACDLSGPEPYGCLGLWCDMAAVVGVCTSFAAEASPCVSDPQCAPGAICNALATPAVCFTSCKP